jgi:hypothetical protein
VKQTEQKNRQKNVGSGESFNSNCGANFIDTLEDYLCGGALLIN